MAKPEGKKQPAQVPGDAESPPQGENDPTIRDAIDQVDKTEPVPAERPNAEDRG